MKTSFYGITWESLQELFAKFSLGIFHAKKLWQSIYGPLRGDLLAIIANVEKRNQQGEDVDARVATWMLHHGFNKKVVQVVHDHISFKLPEIAKQQCSATDGTVKFALALRDGSFIETVLMPYRQRTTICLSSQVGCKFACSFCATGKMGFTRNLTIDEIITQYLIAQALLSESRQTITNVVFMGMGEPFDNYDAVIQAISILQNKHGLAIAPRHTTISTVGILPGIQRVIAEQQPIQLAVSLHSIDQLQREVIVPIGKKYSLDQLFKQCRFYCQQLSRVIFFEWALIAGVNDGLEQARALVQALHDINARVNLVLLNKIGEYQGQPSVTHHAKEFQQILNTAGIRTTIRLPRGLDIDAGCGQLISKSLRY